MAVDKSWLKQNDIWIAKQRVAIKQLENSIRNDQREIELHKKSMTLTNKMMVAYKDCLKQAEQTKRQHLKENG